MFLSNDHKGSIFIISKKAMSPLIAIFILAAVTITLSLATWYFIPRATAEYTAIEKIEISTAVCKIENGNWTIQIRIRNTGTSTVSFNGCFVNSIEVDSYGEESVKQNEWSTSMTNGRVKRTKKKVKIFHATFVPSGQTKTISVFLDPGRPDTSLSSGTKVHLRLRSASGMDYNILVKLV